MLSSVRGLSLTAIRAYEAGRTLNYGYDRAWLLTSRGQLGRQFNKTFLISS